MAETMVEEMAERLRERMGDRITQTSSFFSHNFNVPSRNITPQEKATQFFNMTPQEKQAMFLEMGPEQWANFVTEEMDNAVRAFGPAASKALPFWYTGLPEVVSEDVTSPDIARQSLEDILGVSFAELS